MVSSLHAISWIVLFFFATLHKIKDDDDLNAKYQLFSDNFVSQNTRVSLDFSARTYNTWLDYLIV